MLECNLSGHRVLSVSEVYHKQSPPGHDSGGGSFFVLVVETGEGACLSRGLVALCDKG